MARQSYRRIKTSKKKRAKTPSTPNLAGLLTPNERQLLIGIKRELQNVL